MRHIDYTPPVSLAIPEPISCFLCKKLLGSGFVLVQKNGDYQPPSFLTQIMCMECDGKYKFCSQCGGGSVRTGKYRPQQLFLKSRKTCSLTHVRLGDKIRGIFKSN
jgi:hypothetical protein